jgi:hypothetical protein
MNTECRKRIILPLAAGCGAALLMAASGAWAQPAKPDTHNDARAKRANTLVTPVPPPGGVHTVPPVVAPPNCADGFSQTWVNGQPGGAPFGFGCQVLIACPPGTQSLQDIQVSATQTGSTTATLTYSCSYLNPTIEH